MKNTIFTQYFTMSMISGAGLFFKKIAVTVSVCLASCLVVHIFFKTLSLLYGSSKKHLQPLPFVKTESTAGGTETHQ